MPFFVVTFHIHAYACGNSEHPILTVIHVYIASLTFCFSLQDLVGTTVDLNVPGLSRFFSYKDAMMKSLNVQNIWVREVGPVNILSTTRSIMHELLPR